MKMPAVFACCLLLVQWSPGWLQAADEKGRELRELYSKEIALITIPAEKLPAGCRLAPYEPGANFLPSNPAAITDPKLLPLILMPLLSLTDGATVEVILTEVEAGFSAVYHDGNDRREIGVNLLLFKEEDEAEKRFSEFPTEDANAIRQGRLVLVIWSDGTPSGAEQQMRKYFEERMAGKKASSDSNKEGAANGSQPNRSETDRTSSAAGSRR